MEADCFIRINLKCENIMKMLLKGTGLKYRIFTRAVQQSHQ